jgi:nucleoside-diphosphate-sugar epimerase
MMYMPDAIKAAINLMEADPRYMVHRNSFNIASMSFDPEGVYDAIRKEIPDFKMRYEVDPVRQAIADSWPNKMDDVCARKEWGWSPSYNLETMTRDMLKHLREKLL